MWEQWFSLFAKNGRVESYLSKSKQQYLLVHTGWEGDTVRSVMVNITLGGRSELWNQRKDIRCAEEQFFKQLIQLRPNVSTVRKDQSTCRSKLALTHFGITSVVKSPLVSSS